MILARILRLTHGSQSVLVEICYCNSMIKVRLITFNQIIQIFDSKYFHRQQPILVCLFVCLFVYL